MTAERQSKVVYVLARLDVDGHDYLLFHAHPKWGDWSLVGGHVEADEEADWERAARRECAEEMAPLTPGEELDLVPLPQGPEQWGPEISKSAGGVPTVYRARWFALRFLKEPCSMMRMLPHDAFLLIERERVEAGHDADVTSLVGRFAIAARGLDAVPYAWQSTLSMNDVPLAHRRAMRPSGELASG